MTKLIKIHCSGSHLQLWGPVMSHLFLVIPLNNTIMVNIYHVQGRYAHIFICYRLYLFTDYCKALLNTLSQDRGLPDYRLSINKKPKKKVFHFINIFLVLNRDLKYYMPLCKSRVCLLMINWRKEVIIHVRLIILTIVARSLNNSI